jgi:outer membrane receptor protein involved in Fe transport
MTAEVSLYDIEWQHIQLGVSVGGFGGYENGGTARTQGVEWDFTYIPVTGLTLGFNGAYTNAKLTQTLPYLTTFIVANSGDRLPYVPDWSSSANATYEWPLMGDFTGLVGANLRFTGDRTGDFRDYPTPRQPLPSFDIFDVRAGVETPKWALTLYAKNLFNKIAINRFSQFDASPQPGFLPSDGVAYVYTPRTIGATLTAHF